MFRNKVDVDRHVVKTLAKVKSERDVSDVRHLDSNRLPIFHRFSLDRYVIHDIALFFSVISDRIRLRDSTLTWGTSRAVSSM